MQSVIEVFNLILNVIKQVFDGFIQFFNTIPVLFSSMGDFCSSLFPTEFATYLLALIPIIVTLLVIKFVRG